MHWKIYNVCQYVYNGKTYVFSVSVKGSHSSTCLEVVRNTPEGKEEVERVTSTEGNTKCDEPVSEVPVTNSDALKFRTVWCLIKGLIKVGKGRFCMVTIYPRPKTQGVGNV